MADKLPLLSVMPLNPPAVFVSRFTVCSIPWSAVTLLNGTSSLLWRVHDPLLVNASYTPGCVDGSIAISNQYAAPYL